MPRGIAAINGLWKELQEAKQRAEEEASLARQEADALPARWEDVSVPPPTYEPDSQAAPKPSYGLLDWIPTLWGDPEGYIRPRSVSVPPATLLPQAVFDLLPAQWGGRLDAFPFAPRPDPWTASLATMPPRLPDTLLPVPKTPTPPPDSSLWSGLLPLDLASKRAQWPDPSRPSMLPSMPAAESLPQLLLRRQGIVPVLGAGTLAKIAVWPDVDVPGDFPVLPVQGAAPFASQPQPASTWLTAAQWSGAPGSLMWPEPPATRGRPQSGMTEEPTRLRSAPDALMERDEPLFVWSGMHPTPPSGHAAPDWLDRSEPWAVAAYRQRNAVRPMFGRGDPQRAEDAIRAGLVSAADPFGIPSWLVGQVSPATKDLIRAQYEDQPIPSMIGSLATPTPAFVVRAAETAAKAAPKTMATVLGLGGLALSSDEAEAARQLSTKEAARLRRAHAAGFWRNIPLESGRAPLDEKIASAAIDVEGRIFTGPNHYEAIERAQRELRMPFENMRRGPIPEGFVTNAGRYVSRREATDIASRTDQGEAKGSFGMKRGLAAENTEMATAPATSKVRTAATAPGLPGGEGIWSWVVPESGASSAGARVSRQRPAVGAEIREETAPTWHRAREPAQFDARGLSDTDIQETLRSAWEQGRDAVKLRNYTSPAGRT